ncbi:MAG: hypothetical protein WDZ80_07185 [Candidatus Paceibacterota bacterium]
MIKEKILKSYLDDPIIKEMNFFDMELNEVKWAGNYPVLIEVLKVAISGVKEGNGHVTTIRKMNKILDSKL